MKFPSLRASIAVEEGFASTSKTGGFSPSYCLLDLVGVVQERKCCDPILAGCCDPGQRSFPKSLGECFKPYPTYTHFPLSVGVRFLSKSSWSKLYKCLL